MPRVGFVKPNASNRFTWYGKPGALVERFNMFVSENALWRYDDFFDARSLLEDGASAQMQLTLRGGWSVGMTPRIASYAFDPADYRSYAGGFTPSDRIAVGIEHLQHRDAAVPEAECDVSTNVGNDVDFLETSRVRRLDYNGVAGPAAE